MCEDGQVVKINMSEHDDLKERAELINAEMDATFADVKRRAVAKRPEFACDKCGWYFHDAFGLSIHRCIGKKNNDI